MLKVILTDFFAGMGIGAYISIVPYSAVTRKGLDVTVLTAGSDSLQTFLGMALCCGAFVVGPILKQLRSRSTMTLSSILVVITAIYVYINNSTLHTLSTICLWIASVILIPLGAIPALLSRLIPGISTLGALFISGAFGTGLVLLYGYLPFEIHLPKWFHRFHSFHVPHGGGYSSSYSGTTMFIGGSSYSGTGSYSGSGSYSGAEDQPDSSDVDSPDSFGYPSFFGIHSSSFTKSRKNSWGDTEFYDSYGQRVGESRKNSWGDTVYYDSHGQRVGESRKNSWGGTDHYDELGNRVGESRKNSWGGIDHYDELGNRVGESRKNSWGGIDHFDEHALCEFESSVVLEGYQT